MEPKSQRRSAERDGSLGETVRTGGEAAPQDGGQLYCALFASAPTPFLLLAPDAPRFTVIDVNEAYLAATMTTREGVVGRGLFEAFPDNPGDAAATGVRNLRASLERALSSRRTDAMPRQKYDIARPDGVFEERWWDPYNTPVLDPDGSVAALIHHVSDATGLEYAERSLRRSEERKAFLLRLSDAIRSLADPVAIQDTASRLAGEYLDVGRVAYCEIRYEPDAVAILERDWPRRDMPSVAPGRYRMEDFGSILAEELSAGRDSIIVDVGSDPRFSPADRRNWDALRIRSACSVPLIKDGRLAAYVTAQDDRPHAWTDAEVALLRDLSERTWSAVQRARAEGALREREERQAFLLKISDALRAPSDPVNVGAVATRMLAQHMGVERSYICEFSRERDLAWIGPEYHEPGIAPVAGEYRFSDFPESMRRLETEPLVIADLRNDDRFTKRDRSSIGAMGMNAVLTGILRKGERNYVWALVVGDSSARAWSAEERALVEEAAERTWVAMEHARVEDALRENQEHLQQGSRAKDEFIAMLGHELRNPLAPIATTLQLMKLRAPDVFVREREVIAAQVRYLTGLVDDLLDVARIARGKVELEKEPLVVAEIVAAAVETTQPTMEEHRQSLHTQVEDCLMVTGDRRRLVQVLVNLLGNAAKYSPPDRAIELRATAEDGQVAVRVRDQGRGIAPELLPRIFESFTQETQAIDRAGGGLGLGLAIVRNLVVMHGGSVEARSDGRGKGSEFIVRLPLLERRLVAAELDKGVRAGPAASAKGEAGSVRVKSWSSMILRWPRKAFRCCCRRWATARTWSTTAPRRCRHSMSSSRTLH